MAVAFDAATESVRTGTQDPYTFTHTPVGTPRAVVVTAVHGDTNTQLISSITYGGVELTTGVETADTATEPGRAYIYHLGAGIPTGPQTVEIDLTSATTTDIQFVCMTFTASGDTSVVSSGQVSNNQANPSVTLNYGSATAMGVAALYGGGASPADFTPNGSCVTVHDHDFGNFYAEVIRQSTVSSGTFAIGGTAATDDVAFVALGITDVQSKTIDLDTSNIIAGAIAAPATPDGSDVHVGPSAAASTAAVTAPSLSTPSGVTVSPAAASATAAPSTPDGLDKAIGIGQATASASVTAPTISFSSTSGNIAHTAATATAAGNLPAISTPASKVISLSGLSASAVADVATPEGIDIHAGPAAAPASASVVAPVVTASSAPGATTTVTPFAAQAFAPYEEEPFPWEDYQPVPAFEVSVSPSAAAATAAVVAPTPQLTLGLSVRATATAEVGTTLVGRPIQPTAAAATASGNVPTDLGDSVPDRSIAPQAARATASSVAPSLDITLQPSSAQATATGSNPAHAISVSHIAAEAAAAPRPPSFEVTVGVTAASATTPAIPPTVVLQGSALIRATVAEATMVGENPRSVGVKNFVVLVPRPTEDTMVLTGISASTLVLTPLEEQIE